MNLRDALSRDGTEDRALVAIGRSGTLWPMIRHCLPSALLLLVPLLAVTLAGCTGPSTPEIGTESPRRGDEIVVAGRMFHTGAPVVLWTDPGGYDAYRTERRFAPYEQASYEAR